MEILHPMKKNEKDEKEVNNIQWGKIYITTKLINISTTILLAHDNLIVGVYEIHPKYYIALPINFIVLN